MNKEGENSSFYHSFDGVLGLKAITKNRPKHKILLQWKKITSFFLYFEHVFAYLRLLAYWYNKKLKSCLAELINVSSESLMSFSPRLSQQALAAEKLWITLSTRPGLLEAWIALTSVKYHGNLSILIPLNQRLALTSLRAINPLSQFPLYLKNEPENGP